MSEDFRKTGEDAGDIVAIFLIHLFSLFRSNINVGLLKPSYGDTGKGLFSGVRVRTLRCEEGR